MSSVADPQVFISGAGPTGLVLALWLTRIGVKVRLIDKTKEPGTTSRALVVHARTLEFYRQLGIADELVSRAYKFPTANLWVRRNPVARITLGEFGQGLSPFPYVVIYPQDEHEKLLIAKLKELGVEVERETELLSFEDSADGVRISLRGPSGQTENCQARFLAGCDGARSRVREKLGTGFQGSTYPGFFYVADIVGRGPALNGELHISLDEADFMAIFPMSDKGHARLIGSVRETNGDGSLTWEDVNPLLLRGMKIDVDEVRWFSTYHVHHRLAAHFQRGRVFLLGDAGHIHSPVGGQGMNTGIGDAVNLAWKLGDVLKGRTDEVLLKSYEAERIGFAKELVRSTDSAFRFITSPGRWARFVRLRLVPLLLPIPLRFTFAKRFVFRRLSQIGISYRAGAPHPQVQIGDRLPWIESVDNFAPLRSLDWQVHVYGSRRDIPADASVFQFPWNGEMARKGLRRDAAYLIRPDGHIRDITSFS